MKTIVIIMVLVALLTGCWQEEISQPLQESITSSQVWKNGDIVEVTGKIFTTKSGARYTIHSEDGRRPAIRSKAIDKLEVGTKLWVKGTIEIIHYPKPKGYETPDGRVRLGVRFPTTVTYINVLDFRILTPQPSQKHSLK
jgi:hypothetical protein